ncbi:MAG: ATP-binding protein [Deltaproteobacteria bacterium]|nr:ATP-binding protein [Deltaproteobacteria bacterium]
MPETSILLLGPRGTGKSTWIHQNFRDVPTYDLLNTEESLRLSKEPGLLYRELHPLKPNSWVVLDEVQKVPDLLNEVHRLIEKHRIRFVLCGSSARKLKRGGTNLLAGRARMAQFFPLVSAEIEFKMEPFRILQYGMLPMAVTGSDPGSYLKTYAEVYLGEEIKGEALTQNIGHFGRFLEIAARQNGQVTNVSGISRDAQVARQTVQGYFNILIDTLVGSWLFPWKLKRATKQVVHPKFYFFDSGVVRALSERLPYPPTQEELGPLLETWILHELRAYMTYSKLGYPVYFWSNHNGVEVDFLFETQKGFVAIECKVGTRWESRYQRGLKMVCEEMGKTKVKGYGVFGGERKAVFEEMEVLPVLDFLRKLWSGEIIR